jgi:osmotically inducible protein OsmC
MLREAHAIWRDGPLTGAGVLTTASGILNNTKYTFGLPIGLQVNTSPAEMLAAAIASSMSRMVAVEMAKVGIPPIQVETHALVTLDFIGDAVHIHDAQLKITARTTDPAHGQFDEAVSVARATCPVLGVMNIDVQCEAKLVSAATPALV